MRSKCFKAFICALLLTGLGGQVANAGQPNVDPKLPDPSILADVADVAVAENTSATFSVTVNASQPLSWQWYRGFGQNPANAIAGATNDSYTLPVTLADNNSTFRVLLSAKTGALFSRAARLTVTNDLTPPTIASAGGSYDMPTLVNVGFSKPVTAASAIDPSKYAIDQGIQVWAVVWDSSAPANTAVILFVSQLNTGTTYTLTVNGIKDFASNPNTIAANSTKTFSLSPPIQMRFIDGVGDTTQSAITNNATYKAGGPYNREAFYTGLETANVEHGDNFIGQMRALLTPTVTGPYSFWIAADDACVLYLSTDATPANKALVAGHNSWTGYREYNKFEKIWATLPPGSDGSGTIPDAGATNVLSGGSSSAFASGTFVSTNGNPNSSIALSARVRSSNYNGLVVVFVNDVAVGKESTSLNTTPTPRVYTIHKNINSTVNQIIAAIDSPFTKQKSYPVTLTAGKSYYIEADWKEGGGGDAMNVAWQVPGARAVDNNDAGIPSSFLTPIGVTLGPVTFNSASSPTNVTVVEGQRATFSVPAWAIDGSPMALDSSAPYYFQWLKGGLPITGAGAWGVVGSSYGFSVNGDGSTAYGVSGGAYNNALSLLIPVTYPSDNGVGYQLLVSNKFSIALSAPAILTVSPAVPTAVVGSLFTNIVSVAYSEPMDPVSATAPANYVLKNAAGATIPITAITMVNDRSVNLTVANLPTGSVNVLTISNVKDRFSPANKIATASSGFLGVNAPYVRINNSQNFSINPTNNTLEAGGSDIWGKADAFGFAAQPVTGNFDILMRVDSLANADTWSKVGLMARETLDASTGTSRNVYALVTAGREQGGQNKYQMQYRNATGGSSSSTGQTPPTVFPYAWVRLQRVGNAFYGWASTDGIAWTKFGTVDTDDSSKWGSKPSPSPLPATVLVGVAVTSHNSGATAFAQVSAVAPLAPIPVDFQITTPLADATVLQNRAVTFTIAGAGANGPFSFQWQKNGTDIPGATGPSYTTPLLKLTDNGAKFDVVVKNSTSSLLITNGAVATVTVIADTVPPQVLSAATIFGSRNLVLAYDEDLDSSSVGKATYKITGYRGSIGGASYRSGSRAVVLPLSIPISPAAGFSVVAQNVKDLAGNAAPTTNLISIVRLTDADVGTVDLNTGLLTDPVEPGVGYPTATDGFEVQAGGSDIWNNADGFHFLYQATSGDFDVKVRVESLQYVSDNWAKAGLMVREDLTAGSRDLNMVVDPTVGANVWEVNYRAVTNGPSAGIPGSSPIGPVTYPNAWVRIIREGGTFYELRSTDGNIWETRAIITPIPAYPAQVYVGMATTAHNNTAGIHTIAQYRSFSLTTLAPPPKLVSASGGPYLNRVVANFDSPLDPVTATKASNYSLTGGLTVSAATLSASGNQVVLTTSPQTPYGFYILSLNNLVGANGIPIAPNSATARAAFTAWAITPGFVFHEVWNGIGAPLSKLKASSFYPMVPDATELLAHFESNTGVPAGASEKISGFLTVPASGNYTFYIAASGPAELYLSTDNTLGNKALIATVNTSTGPRQYDKELNQASIPRALTAGQVYYIEALHANGSGNNHLAVTWTGGGSAPTPGTPPIGYVNLSGYANPDLLPFVSIDTQPASVAVGKNLPASFSVATTAYQPVFYQWQVQVAGGTLWQDIDGAISATYTVARPDPTMTGNKYQVLVAVPLLPGGFVASSAATLTVTNWGPLTVTSATSVSGSTTVTVKFNNPLDPATANNRLNYGLFGGHSILSAVLQANGQTVILTIDPPLPRSEDVWPNGVRDIAGQGTPLNVTYPVTLLGPATATVASSGGANVTAALKIVRVGDKVVVTWPASLGADVKLQSGTLSTGWSPVELPIVNEGGNNTVTLPVSEGTTLYRLAR